MSRPDSAISSLCDYFKLSSPSEDPSTLPSPRRAYHILSLGNLSQHITLLSSFNISMDITPPEILGRIFRLACTDDGSIGRSLSLVSPRIRDISTPHKYYSIGVTGAKHIASFATFLAKYRPRIQYLKLDCTTPDVAALPRFELQGIWQHSNARLERICMDVDTIFHILSPTLRGLYLIPATVPLQLYPFTFPLLETLYLRDNVLDISMTLAQMCLPALKRFDISWDELKAMAHVHLFTLTGVRHPSLTHFSCSHNGGGMFGVLSMFATFIFLGRTPVDETGLNKFLPLDVLQIRVPTGSPKIPELLDVINTVKVLEGFPTVVVKNHRFGDEDMELLKEWRYAVEGGEGFMPQQQ